MDPNEIKSTDESGHHSDDERKQRERDSDVDPPPYEVVNSGQSKSEDDKKKQAGKKSKSKGGIKKHVVIEVDDKTIGNEDENNSNKQTNKTSTANNLAINHETNLGRENFAFVAEDEEIQSDSDTAVEEALEGTDEVLALSGYAIAHNGSNILDQVLSDSEESESEYKKAGSYRKRSSKKKNNLNGRRSRSSEDLSAEGKDTFASHVTKAKGLIPSFMHLKSHKDSKSKNKPDHVPHKLFVQLSELQPTNYGGVEWKETARWIKYEEDVEGANDRWGKPHIACLNFNALFSLKKSLETGALLLDVESSDLASVAECIASNLVDCGMLSENEKDSLNGILLLRRNHKKEGKTPIRRMSVIRRLSTTPAAPQMGLDNVSESALRRYSENPSRKQSLSNVLNSFSNIGTSNATKDKGKIQRPRSNSAFYAKVDSDNDGELKDKIRTNLELLKKLPEGCEATSVLVGNVDFLKSPAFAFVRLSEGVFMDNVVEVPIPIRFFFVLLGPANYEMEYHEVGRAFSTLMADKYFHKVAYRAHSREQLLNAIGDFIEHTVVLPPLDWKDENLVPIDKIRKKTHHFEQKKRQLHGTESLTTKVTEEPTEVVPERDPLERKGKLFYGLIEDVKVRYPQYLGDLKDALSAQVLSTTIFIYFATLSSAVTFGGIYGDITGGLIGVGETLLVTSISGIIFALFAAQPLLIVGPTGPLLVFDISLQKFCESMELDFLSIRVWIGIWILLFGVLVVAFELVCVVKKFTRFTEEIFSTFVCIIFIFGAFEKLAKVFKYHPLSSSSFYEERFSEVSLSSDPSSNVTTGDAKYKKAYYEPNTALLSMCFMLATFLIAYKLKHFRNSKYFGRGVRRALGDFGVPIAIFLMVVVDILIKDTYTDKLSMPKGLQPTKADLRGWLIDPFGVTKPLPIWCIFAACPAALLLFIFLFLEENICQLILGKPDRCLKKGTGFHLDIFLSCVINTVAGVLGAPFMGPACVKTIVHLSSLTVMSRNVAPGESPKIVGCIEQRISALVVSVLNGLSVFLSVVLNFVPTSVLFGIFLYMGISATAGIQFLERVALLFMPVKHHPNVSYVKRVKTWKMNIFTLIQLALTLILWGLKQSPAALAIPFVLLCLIPIRYYVLPLMFSKVELIALDGKDQNALEDPDFYEQVHALPTQIENDEKDHLH